MELGRRFPLLVVALGLFRPVLAPGQIAREQVDLAVVRRIRDEGLNRSHLEVDARELTDVVGPRLSGSPGMRKGQDWASGKLRAWGLANVRVEPWSEPFGRGWETVSYSGRILTPFIQPLFAQPIAWTGSTAGTISGPAVIVRADRPEDLDRYRGKLRNAFVLLEHPISIPPEFNPRPLRRPYEMLFGPPEQFETLRNWELELVGGEIMEQRARYAPVRDAFTTRLANEGVAAILSQNSRAFGMLRVTGSAFGRNPHNPIPVAELMVAHEQYGQIWRNVEHEIPVRLEVNVVNRFREDDVREFNVLAEIPGTDKADEFVMLGAHLDSWYGGSGATDNGAGSLAMMEAMRILRALDLHPRRTIRLGLWSGEEQGLLGSRAWIRDHRDSWSRISAYLNMDNGTGKLRGIWTQSNPSSTSVFEQILWPFRDLGVVVVREGDATGTDHLSFDEVGIPGFNYLQDPIESEIRGHHTIADTYERLMLDDLKQAAVVIASTAYHLANRDEMFPRKASSGPPSR
jgi:hypothetical protein